MNILPVLCLLIEVNILSAIPVDPNNYFKALAIKCPIIDDTNLQTSIVKGGGFGKCTNWTEIESTKIITPDNEDNARCLLFFDSFVLFCNESVTAKIEKLDIPAPDLGIFKVDKFCENWKLFPAHKFDHNTSKRITDKLTCEKLCTSYENTVYTECSLAYYFANFNITTLVPLEETHSKIGETARVGVLVHAQKDTVPAGATQENKTVHALQTGENPKVSDSAPHPRNTLTQHGHPKEAKEGIESGLGEIEPPSSRANDSSALSGKMAEVPMATDTKILLGKESIAHSKDNSLDLITDRKNQMATNDQKHKQNHVETSLELSEHQENSGILVPKGETFNTKPDDADPDEDDNGDPEGGFEEDPGNDKQEGDGKVEQNKDNPDMKIKDETKNNQQDEVADNKVEQKKEKPDMVESSAVNENTEDLTGESYFFSYFMVISVLFILGYVGYHNRQKVLALVLEGKRGKRQYKGRRPNSANYHKLDSNLEEAISSTCTKNSSNVIY